MAALIATCSVIWLAFSQACRAQEPPEGSRVLQSIFSDKIKVSYREPGICETTPGVKSYSGYVHMPPGSLKDVGDEQDYPINMFFWFFEARKDPLHAGLSIWMNGGPGGSSFMGLLQENGPCFVNSDSNSTHVNPDSWNNEVNMLYIDQPNQVGFSYDTTHIGLFNLSTETVIVSESTPIYANATTTLLNGIFPSQNIKNTANTTTQAGHAVWHLIQALFVEFPQYQPQSEKISIWTESYGGHYGPTISAVFERLNDRFAENLKLSGTIPVGIDTLGIINGFIDPIEQTKAWIEFPVNNTYGIRGFNDSIYKDAINVHERPGGCRDMALQCQAIASQAKLDDALTAASLTLCLEAARLCNNNSVGRYFLHAKRGFYDISHPHADPFPPPFMIGYLNQDHVQDALGVKVNFTSHSDAVNTAFFASGDWLNNNYIPDLVELLDRGVKVALVYGDRDYACNWIGGEGVSNSLNHTAVDSWKSAGYESLLVVDGDGTLKEVGQVRQHGNLSFSRIYQAGHEVPSYQPEASHELFSRAMRHMDIATGKISIDDNPDHSTEGPLSVWHIKNQAPAFPKSRCYIRQRGTRCTDEVWDMVERGEVEIKDWIVLGQDGVGDIDPEASIDTSTAEKLLQPEPKSFGLKEYQRQQDQVVLGDSPLSS